MHINTTVKTRKTRREMFEESFISSDLWCVSKYETFESRMPASSQTNSKWLC